MQSVGTPSLAALYYSIADVFDGDVTGLSQICVNNLLELSDTAKKQGLMLSQSRTP